MKNIYHESFRLGILGGGQLGRMLLQEAPNLDIRIHILDPDPKAPCHLLAHSFTCGDFNDFDTVYSFGKTMDVITVEIEHVNVEALEKLEQEGIKVYPEPRVLRMVQDKGLQKQFYQDQGIPTAPFHLVKNKEEIRNYGNEFPFMQKLRRGGYDGRGVTPLRSSGDLEKAFDAPSVLEKFVDFEKELSVIVARNSNGEVKSFPCVELEFNPEANLVEYLFSPARIQPEVEQQARALAENLISKLEMTGILAVEMFLTRDGSILVNEIAPRPHNSGHHSIEGNITSQYAQHLRAICGLPLGDTALRSAAVMLNLLGEKDHQGPVHYQGLNEVLSLSGVFVHLYGKQITKPFRKMGHVTVIDKDLDKAREKAKQVQKILKVISK